jgi:hypothetical protein
MVDFRHSWGDDRVYFYADTGRLVSVRSSWTDLSTPDAFVHVSQGRAHFRAADLIALLELMQGVGP